LVHRLWIALVILTKSTARACPDEKLIKIRKISGYAPTRSLGVRRLALVEDVVKPRS
jgi:hypothetical protein